MRTQLVVSMYGDLVSPAFPPFGDWWEEMEVWATELKVPPNEISGGFKEKPKGLVSHNAYKLVRYRSRFAQQLDEANIQYLELMRVWPEGGYKTSDWDFCGLYGPDRPAGAIFTAGVDLGRLHASAHASPRGFSQEAVDRSRRYLSTKYGFAVTMPVLFMGGGYAIGLSSRELPDDMRWDTNAWARFSGKECNRTLRNVYGYNVLTSNHLDISVGGQRLEDWVKASHERGHLEPLGEELLLWTFQEGDDQEAFLVWNYPPVVRVREELKRYDIFPWQRLARQQGKVE
jgi:hypothetical protein